MSVEGGREKGREEGGRRETEGGGGWRMEASDERREGGGTLRAVMSSAVGLWGSVVFSSRSCKHAVFSANRGRSTRICIFTHLDPIH